MKQHIKIYTLVFCFSFLTLKAENSPNFSKHSVNIGIGVATPIFNLKNTDSKDTTSGYAKRGFSYGMQYRFAFKNGLAFYAQYNYGQMSIDENKLNENALKDINSPGTTLQSMKTEGYKINSFSFGMSYIFLKNKKFQIMPKFGFGFGKCQNRFVDATYRNGIFTGRWTFLSDTKSSGNINLGIDFSYKISDRISIYLVRDILVHAPEFDYDDNFQFSGFYNQRKQYSRVFPLIYRSSLLGLRISL